MVRFCKIFIIFFITHSLILIAFECLSNDKISWSGNLFQALLFSLLMAFTFTRYNKVKIKA